MAKYAYHRLDANHAEIRAALESVGATVDGKCPLDLLVGFRGRNYLLEVKTARGNLRASQKAFITAWRGQWAVVRTVDQALRIIGAWKDPGLQPESRGVRAAGGRTESTTKKIIRAEADGGAPQDSVPHRNEGYSEC